MSNRGTKVWYMCKLRLFKLNGAHVPIKSIYKKPSIGLDPPQIQLSCTVVTYISLSFSVCSKSPATFPVTHHRNQTRKIIGPSIHHQEWKSTMEVVVHICNYSWMRPPYTTALCLGVSCQWNCGTHYLTSYSRGFATALVVLWSTSSLPPSGASTFIISTAIFIFLQV